MFNSFFDNESNILDEDENENERLSDENDENESNDTERLECDITEAEVYEPIRMLKKWEGARTRSDYWRILQELRYTCCPIFSTLF